MSLYKDASLVMIPSAYKDGKLYSIRPTDGGGDFTFSRGSNLAATRVDVNGLIEKGRENHLLQSNQFDTTWTTTNASVTSGQTGYDGTNDAWELKDNTSSGVHEIIQVLSVSANVHTYSVKVSSNTLSKVALVLAGSGFNAGGNGVGIFNLANGTLISSSGSLIDAKITSLGGNWYNVSITKLASSSSAVAVVQLVDDSNNTNYTGNGTGSIYIQDAQLEAGLVATDYIETGTSAAQSGILEDMPRLDYSGSCPALLLEPQRTNVVPNSEYFNSGSGWTLYDADVTQNAISSPDGSMNGSKVLRDSTSYGSLFVYNATGYSVTNGNTYMMSAFVKEGSGVDNFDFNFDHSGGGGYPIGTGGSSRWSFDNGITKEAGGDYAGYEDYGNGWYRIWVKGIATADGVCQYGFKAGSGTPLNSYFHIYGVQFEQGSYPTSYIPTYGTSVTRSNDSCLATSVSDLIGQEQGTMFFEIDQQYADGVNGAWSISDGSSSNRVTMNTLDVNSTTFTLGIATNYAGGSTKTINFNTTYGLHKVAIQYTDTTLKIFVDGAEAASGSTDGFGNYTNFYIGANQLGTGDEIREFKQAVLFPTALTDSECTALTSI